MDDQENNEEFSQESNVSTIQESNNENSDNSAEDDHNSSNDDGQESETSESIDDDFDFFDNERFDMNSSTNSDGEGHSSHVLRHSFENMLSAVENPLRIGGLNLHIYQNNGYNEDDGGDDDVENNSNAERFDTDLPGEHSYLGNNMERVSGFEYLEPGKQYRMLILMHHSMLFPGETLPMLLPNERLGATILPNSGILFGLLFVNMWQLTLPNLYGVICQIYERGKTGNASVMKSIANQRFVVKKESNPNFLQFLDRNVYNQLYANVEILPEILLPNPLSSINLGSMNRFRDMDSMTEKIQRFQAATTVWPTYIYSEYDMQRVVNKAKQYLTKYKIESMPHDLKLLSFWLARNITLDTKKRMKLFLTDCVNIRMKLIEETLNRERHFCCKGCSTKIANGNSLFAMSKHGVQTNYCNPSGFIHETYTVYTTIRNSVIITGPPSTEFSWFPGYTWQIIVCSICSAHIGWRFVSIKPNVVPKKFYGLSGSNIYIQFDSDEEDTADSNSSQILNPFPRIDENETEYVLLDEFNLD